MPFRELVIQVSVTVTPVMPFMELVYICECDCETARYGHIRQLAYTAAVNEETATLVMTCQKLVYIDTIWDGDTGNNVFVRELARMYIGEWNDDNGYNLLRV